MKKYWKWNVSFVVCVMLICMFKTPVWARDMKEDVTAGYEISVVKPTLDGMLPEGLGTDFEESDGEESLHTYLGTENSVTSISSSNLVTPQYWKLNISGGKLEVLLHSDNVEDGTKTMVRMTNSSGAEVKTWGIMESEESVITVPLEKNTYPNGLYTVTLYSGKEADGYVWSLASYALQINGSNICFIDNAKSTEAEAFTSKLNQNYSPTVYNGIPAQYYVYYSGYYANMKSARLDEIAEKARELTEQCTTDEEKVRTIHDWVCRNFAYDMEACYDGDITNAADIDWVYENRRGVCSGFARMSNLMFTAVGVPSMTVMGYASSNGSEGLDAKAVYTSMNHEWNVVYLNGSWQNIDVTWDCENKYYGKYDGTAYGTSVFGQEPGYTFYGSPSFNFGGTHYSMQIGALEYVSGISFYILPAHTSFDVGDRFVCDGVLNCELSNGKRKTIALKGKESIYCSGYDMGKAGKQIVTISYCGQELSYMIQVGDTETCTVHTGGKATCKEAAICEICGQSYGIVDPTAHQYDAGIVMKKPTCTEMGIVIYTCSLCGATRQEMLPKAEHDYKDIWETDKEATTTTVGIESRHCKNCDARTDIREIPVIEDDFTDTGIMEDNTEDVYENTSQTGNKPKPEDEIPTEDKTESEDKNLAEDKTGSEDKNPVEDKTESEDKNPVEDKTESEDKNPVEDKTESEDKNLTGDKTEPEDKSPVDDKSEEGDTEDKSQNSGVESTDKTQTENKTEPDKTQVVNKPVSTTEQPVDKSEPEESEEEDDEDTDLEEMDETEDDISEPGDIISTADGTDYELLEDGTLSYSAAGRRRSSIVIPDKVIIEGKEYKVTRIADEAFKDETSLTKITISKNVKIIGESAFSGCKKLKEVSGGNGITTIGNRAFYNCGLTSITIPASVVKIGKEAFKGCKSLKTIQIKTTKLKNKNVGKNAFKNTADKLKVSVPKNKIKEYKKILKSKGASKKMTIKK